MGYASGVSLQHPPGWSRKDVDVIAPSESGPPEGPDTLPRESAVPGVTLRKIPELAPRVTLKMAQVMRSKGLLRPDGHLRADDILVARALANLPGRSLSHELDYNVSRMLRAAVRRHELAPSTLLLISGVRDYVARLVVNADDPAIEEGLVKGAATSVLPVGLWWEELKGRGFPAAAFDLPHPDPLGVAMAG